MLKNHLPGTDKRQMDQIRPAAASFFKVALLLSKALSNGPAMGERLCRLQKKSKQGEKE